ncbi:hypothetical protein MK852_02755 [Shewanella benthica]|uniref:hypothetical protein n=1 Tax=Shewanella benthica TaxID=43661 RepID=UPI00187981C9|nr:hypothetical protein [Shewanella benthica]MBE7213798.1 hypothetical protein [Shewanella benthica]MCL1061067.1 hypothetical protein [Shewanella benthica]
MSILTAMLVLVGIVQLKMLSSQKKQNQLSLLQDYRKRWFDSKEHWSKLIYVSRFNEDYYQVASEKLIAELNELQKEQSMSRPTTWALESVRIVSSLLSDICIRILQGHLEIKDVYPIFGSELLRQSRPLRVLLDVYYPEDYYPYEDRQHVCIRREAQTWLVYHSGIRRRCLILLDLLWAEGVRLDDLCPSDIKSAAKAKKHSHEKVVKRLEKEVKSVNNSPSLLKIRCLKSHLRHSTYRKIFWENGLDEVELDEREEKWTKVLLHK